MKQLNRNIYLLFIGMIEAIFIIYTIIMNRRGIAGTAEIAFGCCAMTIIGLGCIAIALINKIGKEKEEGPILDLTEVPHSREGIIFEVLTVLILAVAWIVSIVTHRFWIEGDFYYLEPVTMFFLTILAVTILWIVYMPRFISMVRRHTNVKQVALEVRMCRVLAVELALSVLVFALPLGDSSTVFFYIVAAVLLVTFAFFRYLIEKARSNPEDTKQETVVDSFDIDHVKVPNTAMGISIEILVGILVVLAWVLGAINGIFAVDDYSASFSNPDMQTDNFDRRLDMFFFTIVIFVMLWYAHRPDKILEKQKWPKVTNLKQVKLVIGSFRVVAIILAIFLLLMAFPSINLISLMFAMGVVTFIGGVITIILIRRARD